MEHDGPLEGIANYLGVPHVYSSIFDEARGAYTNVYNLMEIDRRLLDLAIEQDEIGRRWLKRAAERDWSLIIKALPENQERAAAIVKEIGNRLVIRPDMAIARVGEFQQATDGTSRQYEVSWRPVE